MSSAEKKPKPLHLNEILSRREQIKGKPGRKVYAIPTKKSIINNNLGTLEKK
jgi:hypothetical protein